MKQPFIKWNDKDKKIETEYGKITYEKWCTYEHDRIPSTCVGYRKYKKVNQCCLYD